MLNQDWEIGTAEIVEEEPDLPRTEMEEEGLPAILEDLPKEKKKRPGGPTRGVSRRVHWKRAQTRQHARDRTRDPY